MLPVGKRGRNGHRRVRNAHLGYSGPDGPPPSNARRGMIAAVVAVAALATAVFVAGPRAPFPYRAGAVPERDVAARLDFERPDPVQTNVLRQKAIEDVPPCLDNEPEPIRALLAQTRELVRLLPAVETSDRLPAPFRDLLGLAPGASEAPFVAWKAITATEALRDELDAALVEAFEPLVARGILGPDILPAAERAARVFDVRQPARGPGAARFLRVDRELVAPESMTPLAGRVAAEFLTPFAKFQAPEVPDPGRVVFQTVSRRFAGIPTLRYDEAETRARRAAAGEAVRPVREVIPRGYPLAEGGQPITEEQLALLRLEHLAREAALSPAERLRRLASLFMLVAAVFGLMGAHIRMRHPAVADDLPAVAGVCGLVLGAVVAARWLSWEPHNAYVIAVGFSAMIAAIAFKPAFGLTYCFGVSLLTALALGLSFPQFLVLVGGISAGILNLDDVRTRTKVVWVGLVSGSAFVFLNAAIGLGSAEPLSNILVDCLWLFGWGVLTGLLLGGGLPLVERAGGIVTGISLLELGDQTHPLLQELVRRAPGTHNHSMTVANIAEAAAKRIGADPLLTRVGAYFHDVGKMLKPHYFVENQGGGPNRHANLTPEMSALILIAHVKDGANLAREHGLPERVVDFIEQHHGTTLIEYFHNEALRRERANGADERTLRGLENDFRYPGPKPRSRETAILMIADCCESAGRAQLGSHPSPGSVEILVQKLVDQRLRDGQFDECGLTLSELALIRDSVVMSLNAIYHPRVKYSSPRPNNKPDNDNDNDDQSQSRNRNDAETHDHNRDDAQPQPQPQPQPVARRNP